MQRYRLFQIYKKLAESFLAILFCSYLGSITFFPHTHIVDGVSIVHSHPYSSHSEKQPVDHNHTKNGIHLIHYISAFIVLVPVILAGVIFLRKLSDFCFTDLVDLFLPHYHHYSANRPRAPSV